MEGSDSFIELFPLHLGGIGLVEGRRFFQLWSRFSSCASVTLLVNKSKGKVRPVRTLLS